MIASITSPQDKRRIKATIHSLPTILLKKGTLLFHGTAKKRSFQMPKRPTWFSFTHLDAADWAGWATTDQGDRRVLAFKLTEDSYLINTRTRDQWDKMSIALTGTPDGNMWALAKKLRTLAAGWYGDTEVLLTQPANKLVLLRTTKVDHDRG